MERRRVRLDGGEAEIAIGEGRDIWWYFLVRGLLAAVLGLFALFWPEMSIGILLRLVGLYLVMEGVAGLLTAWNLGASAGGLAPPLAGIVVGVVLLFWPGATARFLLILFGAWAIISGVSQFLAARTFPPGDPDRGALHLIGLVSAALGLVLVFWPKAGVVTLSWLIAAAALAVAALLIYMAIHVRRFGARIATFRARF